jgi:DNA-binding CsgD family transcriptional regulator/PAS domain-containing protein
MPSTEQIPSALLASLYSVLDDPERWHEFLRGLCGYVGTTFASLVSATFRPPKVLRLFVNGLSEEDTQEYTTRWMVKDPWGAKADLSTLVPGTLARGEDYCPDEELESSEAYLGFLKAHDMHYGASAFLAKSDRICTLLSVSRAKRAGPLTAAEMNRIRSLVPHMQRVLRIQDDCADMGTQRQILHGLFDQTAVGFILLDQSGAVLAANAAARAVLDSGTVLRTENHLLRGACDCGDQALREAIQHALNPLGKSPGGEVMALGKQRTDSAGPLLRLLIVPARPGEILAPSSGSPAVVVYVFDPAAPPRVDRELLRRVFSLSKSETTVAVNLACGLSVAETADCLHVSPHTVRSHLKNLFLKTQTTQQSSLVSLILRLQSPLAESAQGRGPSENAQ